MSDALNRDLALLNDEGAIKGLEVREGDGVYITYQDGADAVTKKLGEPDIQSLSDSFEGYNAIPFNYDASKRIATYSTGIIGKTLWKNLFVIITCVAASGAANNAFRYEYDSNTGVVTVYNVYSHLVANVVYF